MGISVNVATVKGSQVSCYTLCLSPLFISPPFVLLWSLNSHVLLSVYGITAPSAEHTASIRSSLITVRRSRCQSGCPASSCLLKVLIVALSSFQTCLVTLPSLLLLFLVRFCLYSNFLFCCVQRHFCLSLSSVFVYSPEQL